MKNKYKTVIIVDHIDNTTTDVPLDDIAYAVTGLQMVLDDVNTTKWVGDNYTVIATKI